ncbi:uncharacterized protein YALI1_E12790g [Yarrowia lipolytica]|uniref:Uncharacterized protein n=1 Tax=Yarrowia lipolytica TaxID=4952 RepID=A0A1D8NHV8_YARLL|nr:hypothetical protein YALI1_E12790g [Yarrowia lipolytica]
MVQTIRLLQKYMGGALVAIEGPVLQTDFDHKTRRVPLRPPTQTSNCYSDDTETKHTTIAAAVTSQKLKSSKVQNLQPHIPDTLSRDHC